jgi:hypothetical protein
MVRPAWPKFKGELSQTIKRIKELSETVDVEADATRLKLNSDQNMEILSLMKSLKVDETKNLQNLPCFYVPYNLNKRSFKREGIVSRIAGALDPSEYSAQSRSLALYGIGGVGKTQVALQYAYHFRDAFEAILWISADSTIKMTQDFLGAAQRLGLFPNDNQAHDSVAAMAKVKSWLADTRKVYIRKTKILKLTFCRASLAPDI